MPSAAVWSTTPTCSIEEVWRRLHAGGTWVWGALEGDFNDEPDMGQIVLATVTALSPFVQQVADIRDLVADLKKLIWKSGMTTSGSGLRS